VESRRRKAAMVDNEVTVHCILLPALAEASSDGNTNASTFEYPALWRNVTCCVACVYYAVPVSD